jgi:pyridoxamine 5'-phosphate oxidase
MTDLANIRRDFATDGIRKTDMAADPFTQFAAWMNDALKADVLDPNAMTVATVDSDNKPSARVVLLKAFDATGFVFFTNYESKKGRDLDANANASFNFFWPQLHRQIAICGSVEKTSREESEKYFKSRPIDSQLAAWASAQSSEIASREFLEERFNEFRKKFDTQVPLPPFWGGFRLTPDKFEFWQGRQNRLHDRIVYTLDGDAWQMSRLSP